MKRHNFSELGRSRLEVNELATLAALAYMLWLPVSQPRFLYAAVLILAASSLYRVATRRTYIPGAYLGAVSCMLIMVCMAGIVGGLHGAPGVNQQLVQWIGAIVAWTLFSISLTEKLARITIKLTIYGIGCASCIILLYILSQRGLVPALPQPILDMQQAGFDANAVDRGGTAIRWLGLSSLTAGAPLLLAAWVVGPDSIIPSRRITGVFSLLAMAATLTAGRRAIVLVLAVAPVAALLLRKWSSPVPSSNRRIADPTSIHASAAQIWVPVVAVIAWIVGPDQWAETIKRNLNSALATYLGVGDTNYLSLNDQVRVQQADALLNAWSNSPFLGHGLGAAIPGYSRNDDRPWMFELQYHALLFNVGIFGIAFVIASILLLISCLARALRCRPDLTPSLIATTVSAFCLIIANETNPYLQAVGHGWGIAIACGLVVVCSQHAPVRDVYEIDAEPSSDRGLVDHPTLENSE